MDTATNPAAINPARLARLKRTSHDESSATAVASTFVHGHAAALIGTFVISWVWFARVVSPLVPYESGSPRAVAQPAAVPEQAWQELHPFVLTCALIHTIIVGSGFALGADVGSHEGPRPLEASRFVIVGVASFVFLCAAYWWACEYEVGPVPSVAARLFASRAAFVLVGATSGLLWLASAALLPRSAGGKAWAASPTLCTLTAAAGCGVHLVGASVGGSLVLLAIVAAMAAVGGHRLLGLGRYTTTTHAVSTGRL